VLIVFLISLIVYQGGGITKLKTKIRFGNIRIFAVL